MKKISFLIYFLCTLISSIQAYEASLTSLQLHERHYFVNKEEMVRFFRDPQASHIGYSQKPTNFYADIYKTETLSEAITACNSSKLEDRSVLYKIQKVHRKNVEETPSITMQTGTVEEREIERKKNENALWWKITAPDEKESHVSYQYSDLKRFYAEEPKLYSRWDYFQSKIGSIGVDIVQGPGGKYSCELGIGDQDVCTHSFNSIQRMKDRAWRDRQHCIHRLTTPVDVLFQEAKGRHLGWARWLVKKAPQEKAGLLCEKVQKLLQISSPKKELLCLNQVSSLYNDNIMKNNLYFMYQEVERLSSNIEAHKGIVFGASKKKMHRLVDQYIQEVDALCEKFYTHYPEARPKNFTTVILSEIVEPPRFLDLQNKKAVEELHNAWKKELEDVQSQGNEARNALLRKRQTALKESTSQASRTHRDYKYKIIKQKELLDDYTEVFRGNCFGSELDCLLHNELCTTRAELAILQEEFPDNARLQVFTPLISSITAEAKQEESVKRAFALSDFARDVVGIVWAKGIGFLQAAPEVLAQGTTALVKGAVKGVATTLDPHHWAAMLNPQTWIEAAKGVASLTGSVSNLIAAEEAQGDAFLVSAVTGNDELYLQKHQEFIVACDEFAGGALQQLQAMSWEELLQGGAELATTFVLDGFVMKAATLYCTKAGKALIKNLAEAIKADSAPERMVELASVGKIALEKGAEEAITLLKSTPEVESNAAIIRTINSEKLKVPLSTVSTEMTNLCEWSMQEGGKMINGRWYTQHALERMAPKNPEVRGVLSSRAIKKGFPFGSEKHFDYTNSRGIPPSVVEDVIQNGIKSIGSTQGTMEIIKDHIKVVVSEKNGAIVTVHPY